MTRAMMGMAIVRVLALGLVMRIGVAIASVMTVGLVMTMALLLVREMALEIVSAALAMVMAARLLVPQSAACRRSRWIVSEVLKLEYALIPAPTSRRLYLH
jgi:hypothetical protein